MGFYMKMKVVRKNIEVRIYSKFFFITFSIFKFIIYLKNFYYFSFKLVLLIQKL